MTLSTNVYILDEIDHTEVFRFCQGLLAKYDDRPGEHEQAWKDSGSWRGEGYQSIHNLIGQGLPAILDINYRTGRPMRTAEEAAEHDEDCNLPINAEWYDPEAGDCDKTEHDPPCWLDVDFDTAYGYKDSRGWGCGDLHAVLVGELGAWLAERGIRWRWRNEFTGVIHDDADSLIELVSGGFEAGAWFATTVLPAIVSDFARGGGGTLEVSGATFEIPGGAP